MELKTMENMTSTKGSFIIPQWGGDILQKSLELSWITLLAQKIFYMSLYFTQGFWKFEDWKFFAPL